MPIPFLLIGIGAGAAALGIGKTVKAGVDQKDANETNRRAQRMVDNATKAATKSRENSSKAIENLGMKKLWVLDNSVESFIHTFERLHNVELSNSPGMDELQRFRLDQQEFSELKQMSAVASSIAGGVVGGAAAGALAAIGAYGGAMTLGACATTGTAIATLSGAAATNATLAFLGGGALSVGGLGIAGGTAVLGGLVAGPALAILGFVVGAKASANKDAAYSNLAKAREFNEEVKNIQVACKGIRMRANMFERLLIKLDAIFEPYVTLLEEVIQNCGTDFFLYGEKEKAIVGASLALAKGIKAVLDTPILTEQGSLTDESEEIVKPVQCLIGEYANEVNKEEIDQAITTSKEMIREKKLTANYTGPTVAQDADTATSFGPNSRDSRVTLKVISAAAGFSETGRFLRATVKVMDGIIKSGDSYRLSGTEKEDVITRIGSGYGKKEGEIVDIYMRGNFDPSELKGKTLVHI